MGGYETATVHPVGRTLANTLRHSQAALRDNEPTSSELSTCERAEMAPASVRARKFAGFDAILPSVWQRLALGVPRNSDKFSIMAMYVSGTWDPATVGTIFDILSSSCPQ